ncbi:MAG: aldose 1-epimerase family protein [Eubacteriales bacterium]
MLHTLKNSELTAVIDDFGAELTSVRRGATEYIWQANPDFWNRHAPVLFPICGRLTDGKYTYRGKEYEMMLHGFARFSQFTAKQTAENELTFTLSSNDETRAQYPFDFVLNVVYRLVGAELVSDIIVKNTGKERLPFAVGLHTGFNVPIEEGTRFEDYRLTFSEDCSPDHLIFSDTCYQTGKKSAFPVENGRVIPLRHDLFDRDAVCLARTADEVTISSDKTERFVRFNYKNFPYLCIWHKPKCEAPYVCLEPWYGLPAFDSVVDDMDTKSDMFRMAAGDEKTFTYSILFG